MLRTVLLAALAGAGTPLAAQTGPSPSVPPAWQVEAVFTDEAPRLDGRLDELLWDRIEPVRAFTQVWPATGEEPTEATEVRIAYDRDHLYVAFRNLDGEPHLIRAQNLERGGRNDRDDHVYIGLDTFRDGRNAYLFEMNALGTQDDATITDEGSPSTASPGTPSSGARRSSTRRGGRWRWPSRSVSSASPRATT